MPESILLYSNLKAEGDRVMSREHERKNKALRRFFTMGEVEAITSLSRSTIYRKMAKGTFPQSVPLSEGRVAWDREAVEEWCKQWLKG